MRLGGQLLIAVFAACVPQQPPPVTPTPGGPPPAVPGEEEEPTRILRLDVSGEIAQPRGDLDDRQNQAKAIRIGWLGANFNKYFSMGGSFRFVATEPKVGRLGIDDRTELYFNLVGVYLRVHIPVAPRLKGFIEAEPALVGMHVPCETGSFTCNEDGFEFLPRFGLTGRVGGIYEAIPGRLDLVGYGSLEQTFPEEGGWLSIGVGITVHYGPTHAEIRRRQQWQQMQMQMQMQQGSQPQRQAPPPQPAAPPPPPPPPPPPTPAPDPYR